MELNLKSSDQIKVRYEGKEYSVKKPKMGQSLEFERELKEAEKSGSSSNEVLLNFLEKLGCPRDFVLDLETDCLEELVKTITTSKKN